jgi:hypothetical protein
MTATEQLAALDGEVARLRARVAELEQVARRAARAPQRALDELSAYERGVEAGTVAPDPGRRAELLAALDRATGPTIEHRPIFGSDASGGQRFVALEAVDVVANDRIAGAREALDRAEAAAEAFVVEHLAELLTDRVGIATAVRDRLAAALKELDSAAASWADEASRVALLGRRSGAFGIDAIPAGLSREAAMDVGRLSRAATSSASALLPLPAAVAEHVG